MQPSRSIVAVACALALLGRVAEAQSQGAGQTGGSTRGAPLGVGDY